MTEVLIGIDPGEITGYVAIDLTTNTPIETHEIEVWSNVPTKLQTDIEWYGTNTIVVMERFIINATTHKKTNQEAPRDIIGAVKWLTVTNLDKPVYMQTAGEAKSFSTNDKLKALGFWHVGGKGHANDAYRHALVHMVNKRRFRDRRLLVDSGEE